MIQGALSLSSTGTVAASSAFSAPPLSLPALPPLLSVDSLSVGFEADNGSGDVALAVDEANFDLRRGEILCLVGESGCGKSVTALSLPRLLPSPPARLLGGRVLFQERNLAVLPEEELRHLRGRHIGMVFQDPMTSLNPVLRVGEQMTEGLRRHLGVSAAAARAAAVDMLARVGISRPEARARDFPHQLSGGMRQRVMIGMALACDPALIIADEPTTALDVTVQKQILTLLRSLTRDNGSGLLLITHDLGVVAEVADKVAVMYAGRIVETGPAAAVLASPAHPYTRGLLRSRPGFVRCSLDFAASGAMGGTPDSAISGLPRASEDAASMAPSASTSPRRHLETIPGTVPGIWSRPSGCAFHPRCAVALPRCAQETPPLFSLSDDASPAISASAVSAPARHSRCWLSEGRAAGG